MTCINIKIHLAFCGANYLGFLALNELEISVEWWASPSFTNVWNPAQIPEGFSHALWSGKSSPFLPSALDLGPAEGHHAAGTGAQRNVLWSAEGVWGQTTVCARVCGCTLVCWEHVQAALVGITLICSRLSCCSRGDRDAVRASQKSARQTDESKVWILVLKVEIIGCSYIATIL